MQMGTQCFLLNQVFVGRVVSARREFLSRGLRGAGRRVQVQRCCDLPKTPVTAPNCPYCEHAVVFHFIPEFFVLQSYLALGDSQSTQVCALGDTRKQSWGWQMATMPGSCLCVQPAGNAVF